MASDSDDLVAVFHASDPEVLPLAETALKEQGIDYVVRQDETRVPIGFGHGAEFGGAENAADILVRPEDAARARDLLSDLERGAPSAMIAPPPAAVPRAPAPLEPPAYRLVDIATGTTLGNITEGQLHFLQDELEEESGDDRDYYIDAATIDMLASAGADQALLALLQRAVGTGDGMDVGWETLDQVRTKTSQ